MLVCCAVPAFAVAQGDTALEREKLSAEVRKLNDEADKINGENGWLGELVRLAPFITAIVALVGVYLTLTKQRSDASRQHKFDVEAREKAQLQRFDAQFQQVAENLASEKKEIRAAAIASIDAFLRPEYADFHERLFVLLLGALRFPRDDFTDKLVVGAFETAAQLNVPAIKAKKPDGEIDLSHCRLPGVDLSGLNLSNGDVAFANLHRAFLVKSNLRRLRGIKVDLSAARLGGSDLQEARLREANLIKAQFQNANLVSAQMKFVDATSAAFQGSRMQEIHLEGSSLFGAHFEGANLNNGYFMGASLDEAAMRSIALSAGNWRDANWDDSVRAELERISSEGDDD